MPALITIPLIGTQRTLLVTAALLAAAASTMLGRRWLVATAAIAALVLVPPGAVKSSDGEVLYEVESPYQFVQVVERDGARRLYLNEGVAVHSLWRPDTVLTGGVWDAFVALPVLLDRPVYRVGGARQRGRHDRARVRRVLAVHADRRRRDRPRGERSGA